MIVEWRSRVPSTERTILSPFTKEYRAPGTPTSIPFFLDRPFQGPLSQKQAGEELGTTCAYAEV
jgi:hypothetical protein